MLLNCPRCNDRSYERLRTHSHCLSCGWNQDEFIKERGIHDPFEVYAKATGELKELMREINELEFMSTKASYC